VHHRVKEPPLSIYVSRRLKGRSIILELPLFFINPTEIKFGILAIVIFSSFHKKRIRKQKSQL